MRILLSSIWATNEGTFCQLLQTVRYKDTIFWKNQLRKLARVSGTVQVTLTIHIDLTNSYIWIETFHSINEDTSRTMLNFSKVKWNKKMSRPWYRSKQNIFSHWSNNSNVFVEWCLDSRVLSHSRGRHFRSCSSSNHPTWIWFRSWLHSQCDWWTCLHGLCF